MEQEIFEIWLFCILMKDGMFYQTKNGEELELF